jgi:glutathione synthase
MKIGFVLDPLDSLKTYKDSSFAMMREAVARGHRICSLMQEDVLWQSGQVTGFVRDLTLTGDPYDWYRATDAVRIDLAELDAVIMRKDPPFDLEYV